MAVAIDPPGSKTGDECGICLGARDVFGIGYLLEDASMQASPAEWGAKAWELALGWDADRFVIEDNMGGDMAESVLETARPDGARKIRIQRARARTSKYQRAQAISVLTEKGRTRMVGNFPALEEQLTSWTPEDPDSPDRLDAFVWLMRSLLVDDRKAVRIIA